MAAIRHPQTKLPQIPQTPSNELYKPVYAVYVDSLSAWSGTAAAAAIGATDPKGYNTFLLAFWIPNPDGTGNPQDAVALWANPIEYIGPNTQFGSTNDEIRANLVKSYHDNGAKVMVSAFGSTSNPTTYNIPATACGENLAQFIIDNQLDGVDLDYEDSVAMEIGTAVPWLIELMEAMLKKFEATGKKYIITNAPQAPYFMDGIKYPQNYVDFNNSVLSNGSTVGDNIDAYLVQFYNQGTSEYSTYTTLFVTSDGWAEGTAVSQIANKGIPISKIVVGKPITTQDVTNSGYVDPQSLADIFQTARGTAGVWAQLDDAGGVMGWQFIHDDSTPSWMTLLQPAIEGN